jgi:hypothetical protein
MPLDGAVFQLDKSAVIAVGGEPHLDFTGIGGGRARAARWVLCPS